MNLEKLLAENMIRFGVKNLSQFQMKKLLKEALVNIGVIASPIPVVNEFIKSPTAWGPAFKAAVTTIKNVITNNQITFNVDSDTAACIICINESWDFRTKNKKVKTIEDVNKIVEAHFTTYSGVGGFKTRSEIQLNESPDAKGKVLSVGVISSAGVSGTEAGQNSNLDDIILFCNSYNLFLLAIDITESGAGGTETINIMPFRIINGKITDGSFVQGFPTQQGGAGSLDLNSALNAMSTACCFYSKQTYDAASAASAGTTRTDIIYKPGSEVEVPLPPTLFATGTIVLPNNFDAMLTKIIADMRQLGTIEKVRIISGASSDRPVGNDRQKFADKAGVPINSVPLNLQADRDKTFDVTDPMAGGNAFLAFNRGQALYKAIGNLAGVTPSTPEAKVLPGGDDAQFVKLFFTVKKSDGTTVITSDDLSTIGVGDKTTNLEGQFKIAKFVELMYN